jgi:hypothetical protein
MKTVDKLGYKAAKGKVVSGTYKSPRREEVWGA